MFLGVLSSGERKLFAQLLYEVAHIDGDFSEPERNQLGVYLKEMEVGWDVIEDEHLPINNLAQKLAASSEIAKKAMMIELVALVYADGEYSESERKTIESVCSAFSFSDQYIQEITEWVNEITPIYIKGYSLAGWTR